MENNKIKKDINNVVNDNLKALEQLFPSVVKDGQLDVKALKEELGDFEEVTTEKYELNWAGKQNAKKIVQQGIGNKTLKFVEKDSKNADTTENIYIEGDNLEVLKLLRQNYYNSIKMIYIDPPYNTGNDFVYNDTFKMEKKELKYTKRKLTIIFTIMIFLLVFVLGFSYFIFRYFSEKNQDVNSFISFVNSVINSEISKEDILNRNKELPKPKDRNVVSKKIDKKVNYLFF